MNVLTVQIPVQNPSQYSVPVFNEEKLKLNCYVGVGDKSENIIIKTILWPLFEKNKEHHYTFRLKKGRIYGLLKCTLSFELFFLSIHSGISPIGESYRQMYVWCCYVHVQSMQAVHKTGLVFSTFLLLDETLIVLFSFLFLFNWM